MELTTGTVRIRVPASSANLGPGFDALGVALSLHDVVAAEVTGPSGVVIECTGEGAAEVPRYTTLLVHRSMVRGFEALDVPVPGVRLSCANAIPHGRGLGSSSAAIVAGLATARALVVAGSELMPDDRLFELAAELEGHPDNVAPAVHGGFTIAYGDGEGRFRAVRLDVDPSVAFVVHVPEKALESRVARGLLPSLVPHADAARNAGRAALLVAALTGRPDQLMAATEDRLHQHYRAAAMPESAALIETLRAAGHPAVVSGAGPTVLALVAPGAAADAMALVPAAWRAWELPVDLGGVRQI